MKSTVDGLERERDTLRTKLDQTRSVISDQVQEQPNSRLGDMTRAHEEGVRQRIAGRAGASARNAVPVLDRPISGRVFFEHVIRNNLDTRRPNQISLIFGRALHHTRPRPTPGRFHTRVITQGVTPSPHIDYKHTTNKQYHKEGHTHEPRPRGLCKTQVRISGIRRVTMPKAMVSTGQFEGSCQRIFTSRRDHCGPMLQQD